MTDNEECNDREEGIVSEPAPSTSVEPAPSTSTTADQLPEPSHPVKLSFIFEERFFMTTL